MEICFPWSDGMSLVGLEDSVGKLLDNGTSDETQMRFVALQEMHFDEMTVEINYNG
jgi:hypothetical protein